MPTACSNPGDAAHTCMTEMQTMRMMAHIVVWSERWAWKRALGSGMAGGWGGGGVHPREGRPVRPYRQALHAWPGFRIPSSQSHTLAPPCGYDLSAAASAPSSGMCQLPLRFCGRRLFSLLTGLEFYLTQEEEALCRRWSSPLNTKESIAAFVGVLSSTVGMPLPAQGCMMTYSSEHVGWTIKAASLALTLMQAPLSRLSVLLVCCRIVLQH
jgi:hypothetical protein